MKRLFVFSLIIAITFSVIAQKKKTDSLKELLTREKTDTGRIRLMGKLGYFYGNKSNDTALIYFRDALKLSLKTGNVNYQIKIRSAMAYYLFEAKADYATSLDLSLQNIKKESEIGDTSSIFWDTRNALFIYNSIGNYSKALDYVNRLKDLVNSARFKGNTGLPEYKAIVNFQFGTVYQGLQHPDSAKKYWLALFHDGRSKKDLTWAALTTSGLGDIYNASGLTDSANYYYRVCLTNSTQIERLDICANCLLGLANLYRKNKSTDSAFFYAVKSYRLVTKNHIKEIIIEAASLLSEIYDDKNQPDSAYFYLKQSVKLRDSLLSQDKIARIQNLSTQETLQKMQDEQTKKDAIKAYSSRIRTYSLSAGLVVLILFLLILYRNNMQRKVANKKIEKAYGDLKTSQKQLIQSEKMASLGELTAGIAHEIQNPLNFVNNFSEVSKELLEELNNELVKGDIEEAKLISGDVIQNLEKINHHGKRADAIVKGMLEHSRAGSGVKELTDINKMADEYLRLSYHGLRAKDKSFNAELITNFDEELPRVNVIPQDIGRVLLNLFNNAFYAVNQKATTAEADYKPVVSVTTANENGNVIIVVKDNGIGIAEGIKDKIMQPFFTTKPTGEGTGLGLSLTYDMVVKGHGGKIEVNSTVGEGSEFIVSLSIS